MAGEINGLRGVVVFKKYLVDLSMADYLAGIFKSG